VSNKDGVDQVGVCWHRCLFVTVVITAPAKSRIDYLKAVSRYQIPGTSQPRKVIVLSKLRPLPLASGSSGKLQQ